MPAVDQNKLTPELHEKLSKKVAQLTKVVHALNTRNEDHETRLQETKAEYEAQIASLEADAAAKLKKAGEAGAGAQQEAVAEAARRASAAEAAFEKEKRVGRAQLDELRAKLQGQADRAAEANTARLRAAEA